MILGVALAQAASQELQGLSPEKLMVLDRQARTLSYLAKVNGKYLPQATRHASIYEGGKCGDNMTTENKETTSVGGDELVVSVTWAGAARAYSLDEVVLDSNQKPIQVRFGGNQDNALKHHTGCLICLDSCPVGIASNAAYTYGAVEKRGEVQFTGNAQLLPPDGTLVVVTVGPKK